MGYGIYIGEPSLTYDSEDLHEYSTTGTVAIRAEVTQIHYVDAPCFENDELSQYVNNRHPSYSTWHDFTVETGMEDLWYDKEYGILSKHPGIVLLTPVLLERFIQARDAYKTKYPSAVPRFNYTIEDAHLARLEWLVWWANYALLTCRIPAIYNH